MNNWVHRSFTSTACPGTHPFFFLRNGSQYNTHTVNWYAVQGHLLELAYLVRVIICCAIGRFNMRQMSHVFRNIASLGFDWLYYVDTGTGYFVGISKTLRISSLKWVWRVGFINRSCRNGVRGCVPSVLRYSFLVNQSCLDISPALDVEAFQLVADFLLGFFFLASIKELMPPIFSKPWKTANVHLHALQDVV